MSTLPRNHQLFTDPSAVASLLELRRRYPELEAPHLWLRLRRVLEALMAGEEACNDADLAFIAEKAAEFMKALQTVRIHARREQAGRRPF